MKRIFVKIFAAIILLAMLTVAVIVTKFYFVDEWADRSNDKEKGGSSNCTLVTAFFAFDPSAASATKRNLIGQLHGMFRLILHLHLPMVVFTDAITAPLVTAVRHSVGMQNLTRIWNISMSELPLWLNFSLFQAIINEQQNEWDQAAPTLIRLENRSLEFRILANSKSYFLQNASAENLFNSTSFAWMDPTYGHGKPSFFPDKFKWQPKFPSGKISLLKLAPVNDSIYLYDKESLYQNRDVNLLSTEFLAGGDRKSIEKFHQAYVGKLFDEVTRDQMFDDDDQALLLSLIKEKPSMFNVVQGEWFNAFLLF